MPSGAGPSLNTELGEIPAPVPPPVPPPAGQVSHGPPVSARQRILIYTSTEWEGFIHEWTYFSLKGSYSQVQRFGGAGDRGVDIAGFTDSEMLQGVWDNYQCKHYGKPLGPAEARPEIAKVLWYSFIGGYRAPRRYFFVAPREVSTILGGLLADAAKLKNDVLKNWDDNWVSTSQEIRLEGAFREYVEAFDFKIFGFKTMLEVIEGHRGCPYFASRFGGGLPTRPPSAPPPDEIQPSESRYVAKLLSAYGDYKRSAVPDVDTLRAWPPLNEHFKRQREAFYRAEALRVFARDNVPAGTFESLQDDVYDGVIDVHEQEHPNGYVRVREVTKAARLLPITENGLVGVVRPKDKDGICHQLANDDRLEWTRP